MDNISNLDRKENGPLQPAGRSQRKTFSIRTKFIVAGVIQEKNKENNTRRIVITVYKKQVCRTIRN